MDGIDTSFVAQFKNLPSEPPISLRGGDALDEHREVPAYEPSIDKLSPDYLETYFWGITYLDAISWRYYLPYLLGYAIQKVSDPNSNAVDHFLSNLRPPDRQPPRFGSLSSGEQSVVVSVLEKLAFSEESVWQDQAIVALEEYWGPGALYR
ncbi:DUF6714 family protein [Marinobacter sp. R17]|uniref:DUF6714 family protein n=1 Tax=Marinobacter sp. R17 TaxID=2484250 RepID=UPI000F4C9A1F|nr:DUF6714 family protein [Marinobacter sp. R17]